MSNGNFLTRETKQGLMDIYVASPETKEKLPVVIVLQEAFGVNPHIRSVCDRLAREGFLAAAPELFHRVGRRIEIPYGDRKLIMPYLEKLKNEEIIQDVRDTMNFLENLPTGDTKNISTLGFCMGGFASVLCATKLNPKKMVSFYGAGMVHTREGIGLTPILPQLSSIKARCLFFFGGKDVSIPHSDIEEIEKKMRSGKVPHEVNIFENSDHGFFCDDRKTFNQEDASVAWKRTLSFLKD